MPPGGAMTFGRLDGSIVPVTLDGTTEVEGDGATTMLGATVKTVALSVPVGLMLCGAVLLGATTARVSVPVAAEAELETEYPEAITTAEADAEPDGGAPDPEVVPSGEVRPVADTVAVAVTDSLPKVVPEGAERLAGPVPKTNAELCATLSDAVAAVAEFVAGVEPDVTPEVGTPVCEPAPELAGPVADVVSGGIEADGDPVTLVTGMTGMIPELDVTGGIEDKSDVLGSGMFVVGIAEETPSVAATEGSSEETTDTVDNSDVGRSEGSREGTAVTTDGMELCPVPGSEEIMPLERTLGLTITGIVASVEDPAVVETGTPPLVEVPSIVSKPTVIPDEVINRVTGSVNVGGELIAEVMAGMTTEGRIPVDDPTTGLVATLGLVTPLLVTEVPPMGTTGTTPVLEAAVTDAESGTPEELIAAVTTGNVEAVPTKVCAALLDPITLVERTSEPRLFVAVKTTDDNTEGDEGAVITGAALLSDVSRVGRDEAIITGADLVWLVRLVPGGGLGVTTAGIEDSRIEDPAEVATVTRVGTTTADVSPGSLVVTDVTITTEESGAEGESVSGLATVGGDVAPGAVVVAEVTTPFKEDETEGATVMDVATTTDDPAGGEVTIADVATITCDDPRGDVTMDGLVAKDDPRTAVRDSTGNVVLSAGGTALGADEDGTFVFESGEGLETTALEAAGLDTAGSGDAIETETAGLEGTRLAIAGTREVIALGAAGLEPDGLDGLGPGTTGGETAEMDGIGSDPAEAVGMDELGAAALEETGSGADGLELAAGGLEAAGPEVLRSFEAGTDTTELDTTGAGREDSVGADEGARGGLGTELGMTIGAEVGADGAVVAGFDAAGTVMDVAAEAGMEAIFTIGADAGVEIAAGVPVMGEPITEPDESIITVTGTTTTAVSVPEVILDDAKLGFDTTTGDSCLELSTFEVN